ncbi:MAG: phosphoribosyltransferase, partial [uncultured bacterium]
IVLGKVIADYFEAPLAPLVIRKIGAPMEKELAIGAVGPKRTIYWEKDLLERLRVDNRYKRIGAKEKTSELEEIEGKIKDKKIIDFADKKTIVVDDGVATGTTVICAQKFLKKEKAKSIILAVPVIAEDSFDSVSKYFDRIITLNKVRNFYAVGQFYKDFPQISNKEVLKILN